MRLRPLLISLLLPGICVAQSTSDLLPYGLREHRDDAGTIRRVVAFSAIPFDKPYAKLTQDQQALVKCWYNSMSASDEPPYPIGGLQDIYGPVSRGQQHLLAEGEVDIDVEINASGEAIAAKVFKSPSEAATQFVASVALLVKYKPGICGGQPCSMAFPIRVKLTLR